jgi:HTH-type transcriptional regulator/antitoxin HigA
MSTLTDDVMTLDETAYLALLTTFPPHPIRTDAELDAAITVIDGLLDRDSLTGAEQEFLDLISELVESYERNHVVIPTATGIETLWHLMEENGLRQADLVQVFGSKSIVSEVLSGKRGFSKRHLVRLSERFGLPAGVFLPNPSNR